MISNGVTRIKLAQTIKNPCHGRRSFDIVPKFVFFFRMKIVPKFVNKLIVYMYK